MGKNNKLINQMRLLAAMNKADAISRASDQMVPELYAAMAIALHRVRGFDMEQIEEIFAESQKIWQEFEGEPDEMIELCEKETGIAVRGGN